LNNKEASRRVNFIFTRKTGLKKWIEKVRKESIARGGYYAELQSNLPTNKHNNKRNSISKTNNAISKSEMGVHNACT
jgi:hypothetical protein